MVDFGGWDLPQQYTSIRDEHLAVRKAAGLFDVSHMGRFRVTGGDSFGFLQSLVTNDLGRIQRGQAQYNLLCTEAGGIVDDLIVYWGEEGFFVVVNASNREKDLAWMREHAPAGVEVEDRTFELSLLALQGPRAEELIPSSGVDDIPYFGFRSGKVAGVDGMISRTGYTGEDGFELYAPADRTERLWTALVSAGRADGVAPIGLGARDTLRLEMKYVLYGNDIDETTNALEAGLGWVVKPAKGDFIGREALEKIRAEGVRRRLVGIEMVDKAVARHGYPVLKNGRPAGIVTSGSYGPSVDKYIAMAYVETAHAAVGTPLQVEIRGQAKAAPVVRTPFYPSRVKKQG